ncbi:MULTISPECIES: hypothetical protein [Bradyrhizobium]|uniref:DUF2269 family protein n=1 Tax=Bradyrhizobium diversitatis TaxID=2755406 RepID=A0ABS0PFE7_9BRAD|nr:MULTISPECIES: hypothetical protein [Bradyrhizobium]MBH5391697.1 hypothetical protein [Bradyrhizobium diversitatis]UPJ67401.1 hypothetical protein IVB23_08580 [Bradyrhizobium sp. 191]
MSFQEQLEACWGRLFRVIGKQGAIALPLGAISYILLLLVGIYGLFHGWPPTAKRWIALKGFYGLLTIAAPFFFFCEYVFRSERRVHEDPTKRATRLLELKNLQDQGRAVWLACATVIGLIIFKGA